MAKELSFICPFGARHLPAVWAEIVARIICSFINVRNLSVRNISLVDRA